MKVKSFGEGADVDDFILLSGRGNPALAHAIGEILGKEVYEPISVFSNGEIRVRIQPNLRRRYVFIIQPTASPVNDNIMELIFMVDAAKRASAKEVIAVIPHFGYSRQDRKEMSRVPISAAVVASMIEKAGVDHVLTVDIHSEQSAGFMQKPWDNVYASHSILPVIKERNLKELVVASPDKGGMLRATGYAKLLNADGLAIVYKERDVMLNNKSETVDMIGDVAGRDVLLVDDMIDTGGTIVNAANFLKKKGAKSIRVACTHGLFSGDALEKISKSEIEEVIITDTVLLSKEVMENSKITMVSVAPLLAESIRRIRTGESISDLIL
jgi:ribose-phosphate pyrophosphokinase